MIQLTNSWPHKCFSFSNASSFLSTHHIFSIIIFFLINVGRRKYSSNKGESEDKRIFFSSELITGCWRSHSAADRPLSKLHCPCLLPTSLNSSITLSAMNKRPNKTINPSLFVSSLDACRGNTGGPWSTNPHPRIHESWHDSWHHESVAAVRDTSLCHRTGTRSGPLTAITVLGTSEMLFSLQAPFRFLGKEFAGLQGQQQ